MTIEQISKYVPTSKCGKYVYPIDSVTGAKTFAPIDYFNKYRNILRLDKETISIIKVGTVIFSCKCIPHFVVFIKVKQPIK
jgi:hypothetical protein